VDTQVALADGQMAERPGQYKLTGGNGKQTNMQKEKPKGVLYGRTVGRHCTVSGADKIVRASTNGEYQVQI
jgi:hypothetical protein